MKVIPTESKVSDAGHARVDNDDTEKKGVSRPWHSDPYIHTYLLVMEPKKKNVVISTGTGKRERIDQGLGECWGAVAENNKVRGSNAALARSIRRMQ